MRFRLGLLVLVFSGLCAACNGDGAPSGGAVGEGEMCGGIAGIVCAGDLWCDLEPGFCDGADIAGTCVVVREACTRDYTPVCGCDGQTYGNNCTRIAARAQMDHPGECRKP